MEIKFDILYFLIFFAAFLVVCSIIYVEHPSVMGKKCFTLEFSILLPSAVVV